MIDINNFDALKIGLASPEQIRAWSRGEVKKPETINYRTLKPEREGLFCEKIFGPQKDWECHCGKYKRIRYKGVVCDRCGVEVTRAKVRRERMGHIELAAPVSHIWYFKGIPSRMGLLLDMSPRALEKVLYFASYVVTDPGETSLSKKQLLTENEYRENYEKYAHLFKEGKGFKAEMGAEAIKKLLDEIDLDALAKELRGELKNATGQRRIRAIRRLEVVEAFRMSNNKPSWMILDVLPVLPPDLRPMVQLDGGRFATADLNDLYRRVINRNNRLKRLLDLGAPDIIVRNEKRMLQEAVDALIDNGRRGRPVTGPGNRPLKSLSDMLKGKQGRFRQNLLGKRVDYSGRSVIVVGPELKISQCGLPKEMALELFKPFVMRKLFKDGIVQNIKTAKKMVEKADPQVWDILEHVIKEHPVLLNRAPTLHRLGIQAFEPVLVEGRAIKIHPLVCTAYNADFDGDQMAVHVPLSSEAQAEARLLMLAAHNILNPKDGKPVTTPTQDMVLGCYYLTIDRKGAKGEGKYFGSTDEVIMAYQNNFIDLHAKIALKVKALGNKKLVIPQGKEEEIKEGYLLTTPGRIIFNEIFPEDFPYINRPSMEQPIGADDIIAEKGIDIKEIIEKKADVEGIKKGFLGVILSECFRKYGTTKTAEILDKIKKLGFTYSTRAGITIAVSDIMVPPQKKEIMKWAEEEVNKIERSFRRGFVSDEERYNRVIEIWSKAKDDITKALMKNMDKLNPINMMAGSGARGNVSQITQLAGMRGLMADPTGHIIELPIKANFREGLTVLEYFISTHGARKGLADTALKTADSGYLTRRLVDVAQDVIVREEDCGTTDGITVTEIKDGSDTIESLEERLVGRHAAEDIVTPDGEVLVKQGEQINEDLAKTITKHGLIKSPVNGTVTITDTSVVFISDEGEEFTYSKPKGGKIYFNSGDRVRMGETVAQTFDRVKIRSVLTCKTRHGVCVKCYGRDLATGGQVSVGEAVGIIAAQSIGEPGTQLTMRTFHTGGVAGDDITQGLPRVEELFEARKPKGQAIVVEEAGIVTVHENKNKREVEVKTESGESKFYTIPYGARLKVKNNYRVEAGDPLTEGSINPHDLLKIKGVTGVQEYLTAEVQKVYRLQGVEIADKHIEVIVKQMLRKYKVEEAGDSYLLPGSYVDMFEYYEEVKKMEEQGLEPPVAKPILLGITKASLATDSFLSAASFQETTRVLTEASIKGKIDPLIGLKENVIIGKLIPAGSGMSKYTSIEIEKVD
ncbi:DNA-directed RNA polymerase subunit beta' [Anaerobranca gottschalkii]|uniref:DNA-directed RNA polymerase subunit beta' n=1 Tax=Anaerobranca gottschalkii DSM 13577 TaxID=1120990 RepID=A0A1I0BIY5_9FIRM|nr:DNA-directed RNA polymerase subunit beta' [Anaerobranca gottschalkii]SET06951.1 DNA-directed RNA polymerase subunit beta' [Anaerobranca gottschalkii DSM 13577]